MNPTNIWTIARRDFRSYFTSPIASIIIAGFLLIVGWMFFFNLDHFASMAGMGRGNSSITDGIVRPLFGNINVILLFLTPFITMRLFAEERKNHTLELLITSPASLLEIILGKFFSSLLLILVMLGITLIYPALLFVTGNPDIGPIFTCYLGTILLSSCYLSLGVLFSSVTENQIVAGALTFAGGLFFWLISWASNSAGPVLGEVFTHLSLISHFNNFSQGIVNTVDLVYYLTFIFTGLFLTHRVLDSYRWR